MITNREEVIDKAFKVFLRMNYEKASISTLAKACGVVKTPVFLKDLLYNQYCLVAYILLVGMFLGVKLATYTVEYAIYKSKFIGNKER